MPKALQEIIEDFQGATDQEKLELLLEFSDELPELPKRFTDQKNMERVVECQSPLFLAIEKDNDIINIFFSAPPEAPTTRGFASILNQGINHLPVKDLLSIDENIPDLLGLKKAISPLRLRGMGAMITRIKRKAKQL
ncbi:MAG: SufE family protein [Micrococcaceae bacterium]